MVIRKTKAAFTLLLLFVISAFGQPKPRIDFDRLLSQFPDLPWDFEIRYVLKSGSDADMLRIHYNGESELVRWRAEYPGSLASVCHSELKESDFRKLLELLRDKRFNDLPSDGQPLVAVAVTAEATVSVRLGKLVVRKVDRHQRERPSLREIESALDDISKAMAADSRSKCGMESVPARP